MNSDKVIKWFNNIDDDIPHKCFINFDIKDFYPSITKNHLIKAIEFGNKFRKLSNEEIGLLIHTCQTIVCYDNIIIIIGPLSAGIGYALLCPNRKKLNTCS